MPFPWDPAGVYNSLVPGQDSECEESDMEAGMDSDVAPDLDEFKSQLKDCLDDVENEGSFSAFRPSSSYVNPGLFLKNYGPVGLPLAARDAENIVRICNQSPFGKGAETIIDTSVRKTWELDSSEFYCQNPAWTGQLDLILEHVVEGLGVKVPTKAEPYKLLLYEEGAFFKAHKDSEKVPGMFGTMVISLPSEHSGGDVKLVHNGRTRTLRTSSTSAFDLTSLAWYSDVSHEVQPVTAGHRLVVTYNLVQQDSTVPTQTAAALDKKHAELEGLLETWTRYNDLSDKFVYPLSHEYTEASLSLKGLKGSDAAKGRYLEHVCQKSGVYWFLANLTKTTMEDADDDEAEFSIENIVTPTGNKIKLNLQLYHEHILAEDLYDGRDADSMEEGEYTGNEGMGSTYRYRNTVFILVNKDAFQSGGILETAGANSLRALLELIRADTNLSKERRVNSMRVILNRALRLLTSKRSSFPYVEPTAGKNRQLFIAAAKYCHSLGLTPMVREVIQRLPKAGEASLTPIDLLHIHANEAMKDASDGVPDAWDRWFANMPVGAAYKNIHDMRSTFEGCKKDMPQEAIAPFEEWQAKRLDSLLRTVQKYSREDVAPLIALIPTISPSLYFEEIIPKLARGSKDCLSFFLRMLASGVTDVFRLGAPGPWESTVQSTFDRILQTPNNALKISVKDFEDFRYAENSFIQDFVEILDITLTMNLTQTAARFVEQAWPSIPSANIRFWRNWRAPFSFAAKLLVVVERHNYDNLNCTVSRLIPAILRPCVKSLAQERPPESMNWARPTPDNCGCGPCQPLHHFLRDPDQQSARFAYAEHIRKHLEYKLESVDYRFATEKTRSPHTLVIHKLKTFHARAREEWKGKVRALRSEFLKMHTPFTQELFGYFEREIQTQCDVLLGTGTSNSLHPVAPSSMNSRTAAPIAGVKRKVDVVDLTGDASD